MLGCMTKQSKDAIGLGAGSEVETAIVRNSTQITIGVEADLRHKPYTAAEILTATITNPDSPTELARDKKDESAKGNPYDAHGTPPTAR